MDWQSAVAALPPTVLRLHHGRDPAVGLDCIGLVMFVCRRAGAPFDDLDVPYGVRDAVRPHRYREVERRLNTRFPRAPVDGDWRDGDILMIGDLRGGHLGVFVGGMIYQMTEKLLRDETGRLSPFVTAVWRAGAIQNYRQPENRGEIS